ncbi:MAG: transcription antiterminator [Firmicutes bacterium]|nr:transcription antiterminator [Bacillota bacterium]
MSSNLSSREKKIIVSIIHSNEGITIKDISEDIGVSRRTILREISGVYDWFTSRGYTINRNSSTGLSFSVTKDQKEELLKSLEDVDTIHYYSIRERHLYIITELLQATETLKIYTIANVLGVSEATISHDLNKVQEWLQDFDLELERKQGFGVVVNGKERNKRKALINILYEMLDGEQLKDAVSRQIGLVNNKDKNSNEIRNKLLNMIDLKTIKVIEDAISASETQMGFKFAESSYTALAVHLALALQRIKNGERILMAKEILEEVRLYEEFVIASKLIMNLEKHINLEIPEDEVGYVTMHLKGARYKNGIYDTSVLRFNELIISNYQLTSMINEMIKIASSQTGYDLKKADSLLVGLVDHLRPAINRLQMNLDIRNPLLAKIKEEYADIFEVSKACAEVINKHLGVVLPESEVGYIAMHIGSAVEQLKNVKFKDNQQYNIVVTCISGIGTSKMLAERIKHEFTNINIVEVFATTNIKDEWLVKNDIDLIVSTVHFVNDSIPVIAINPLLLDKDVEKIKQKMSSLALVKKDHKHKNTASTKDKIKMINEYSGAIIELLENFVIETKNNVSNYEEFLEIITTRMTDDPKTLLAEITKREEIGSIVFEEEKVIFFHTRSTVVEEIKIGVFRNKSELSYREYQFDTALVLVAPKDVSKEKLEIIGEISSRVVSEENFLNDLKYSHEEDLYRKVEGFLNQFLTKKINRK